MAGRAMVADGRLEVELVFGSARGYGCAEWRAAYDTVRVERLVGGMAGDAVAWKLEVGGGGLGEATFADELFGHTCLDQRSFTPAA